MRKTSHMQGNEAILENFLSKMRFYQASKFVKKDFVVADLGCGYHGNFLKSISKNIKSGIGYDVSISNKGLPKNIRLKKINLNKINGFKNNYFDLAVALAVLEHVEKPEMFLKQINHILKRGGMVVITTPHKRSKSILEFISFKLGLISKNEISDHKNYFDEISLKKAFKNTGFININIKTFEFGLNLAATAQKI